MIVANPFLCFWGSLDAIRGAGIWQVSAAWIFPLLIGSSLIAIGVQLRALHGRERMGSALAGQFVMGLLLTAVAVLPLWSPANLPAIRHTYHTIPAAFVLPPLTLVALANAIAFHVAVRAQPSLWRPAMSPRSVMVAESMLALAVALACAGVVIGALAADPSLLAQNLQWGGLIVVAVALTQLAVTAHLALGGARLDGSDGTLEAGARSDPVGSPPD